ncbi:DUF3618 domain-containing protein [Streptomyces sp. B6B3]|uniref:DUF3618 domain-containing protein n=1 Tax=Streptomyces sp. B6B3 TaxID=3153570 RepID=UPI00325CACDF
MRNHDTTTESTDERTDRLRGQVAQTREQLGRTVAALAAKADVKGRVQGRAARAVTPVREKAGQATRAARRHPLPTAAAPIAVAAAATYAVVHRARRNK